MLIKDNFRHQFYEAIKKQSIAILVATDLDAVCSALILSHLLKCDDVAFSLIPVSGWEDVQRQFAEMQDQRVSIVMINCGAGRSLTNLNFPPWATVYIVDSRRPFHHDNVFDAQKIRILVDNSEIDQLGIPDVRQVMHEGSDNDSEDDTTDVDERSYESRLEKIRRKAIKKEEQRLWDRQRVDVLWRYYENAWHSVPSCVRFLELAASLNRTSAELMWFACVGLNGQVVDRLISVDLYTNVCIDRMRPFIHKFGPRGDGPKVDDSLRISFGKELPVALYSHWDLYNAMMVDEYFAIKTKNWTQKGDANIRHLLASLGITLAETKQKFGALSTEQKDHLVEILDKEIGSAFGTFFIHLGYSTKINAADVARAASLKLEVPRSMSAVDRFSASVALIKASIGGSKQESLEITHAFDRIYQRMLGIQWRTVASAINQSEILPTGPYYLFTSTRALDQDLVESRHFLYNFANFLLRAFAATRRGRSGKPLIVTFPLGGVRAGWIISTAVMPLATLYEDRNLKSVMGRVFERVRKMASKIQLDTDYFDTNIVMVKSEDRARFFDCLQSILEGNA